MLHLLYIAAFTVIAVITVSNLIKSLISVSFEPARRSTKKSPPKVSMPVHPELLDRNGQIINEPLLVIRSVGVEDARERLDRLFQSSPGSFPEDLDPQ